ncbi:hypothetical protein QW180_18280 [Vibrio sinaloensis]|nr:hypothetical protein [Vibrio sinaloensis]
MSPQNSHRFANPLASSAIAALSFLRSYHSALFNAYQHQLQIKNGDAQTHLNITKLIPSDKKSHFIYNRKNQQHQSSFTEKKTKSMAIPRDTKQSFVQKAKEKWGDKYCYESVTYLNSRTPVKNHL